MPRVPTNINHHFRQNGDLWREVPGLPGYDVSYDGLARSRRIKGRTKPLTVRVGHNGYLKFNCVRGKVKGTMDLHRAIGLAYLGPAPGPAYHVDHIDTCRTNCHIDNLQWSSPCSNAITRRVVRHTALTKQIAYHARNVDGKSYGEIASVLGIDHRSARRFARG